MASEIKVITVAILGAGLMGKWHAHYAKKLGAKISAVIDSDLSVADVLAKQFGAKAYANLEQAMDGEEFDVLHVCTPASTHVELIKQALSADKHVIAEKPLAENLDDVIKLASLAKEAQKILSPVHQFPFQAGIADLKKELAARDGDILHVTFDIVSAGAVGRSASEMNQILVEILPHPFSIMTEVWGRDVIDSNINAWEIDNPRAGELYAYGRYAPFPVAIKLSMNARPTQCKMTVYHEQGAIHVDLFHGFSVIESAKVSRQQKVLRPFVYALKTIWSASMNLIHRTLHRQFAYPGLEQLIGKCYVSVANREPAPITAENYIFVAKVVDHIKRHIN